MTAPARALIVGYGFAGAGIHDPLISATNGIEVAGVVTTDPERSARALRRHPDVAIFDDWRNAVDSDFDVVVLAVPNEFHLPMATEAIEMARHVVIDKPVTSRLEEADRLAAIVERAPGTVSVFHNRRWDGDFMTVARLVREGDVGRVHRFESRFDRWTPSPEPNWRDESAASGGGILLDLGSHLVDQAIELFGPVTTVYAELGTSDPRRRSEDRCFVSLTHRDGVISHLFADAREGRPDLRFHVSGSAGSYVKHFKDVQEERLLAGEAHQSGVSGVEPRDRWGVLKADDVETPVETLPGDWTGYYSGVVEHLRAEEAVPVKLDEAIEVLAVLESARRSAEGEGVVTVDPERWTVRPRR